MPHHNHPGLGELLRYVGELVERGAENHYKQMGLNYRARFTPVLRALESGLQTVTEITAHSHLTQGAVSQTVAQMETEGLIVRQRQDDGRKSLIVLTEHGQSLVETLGAHWAATFAVIESLEHEIGHPLRRVLEDAATALERQDFGARLTQIKQEQAS